MSNYIRPNAEIRLRESDSDKVVALAEALHITPVLAQILVGRGLTDFEESKLFFNPSLDNLINPFLFGPMQKIVERLAEAKERNETIGIHGDYDVDGVTSTSVMTRVLRALGIATAYYLPNRLTEGYGVGKKGMDFLDEAGAKVIITVDCGITANEPAEYAKELGIDFIITDHHEPQLPLPDAFAILDHKHPDNTYPEEILAGVGTAFKLCQALCTHLGADESIWQNELDLAALGSAADIVPLVGENRLITKFGYEKMMEKGNLGLAALMEVQGIADKVITTADVVFKLAPAVNAAGRLGDPSRGVKLFTSEDEGECRLFATELVRINDERRVYHEKVEREAIAWAHTHIDFDTEYATVVSEKGWHAGVIGIVASKLVDQFCRPAVLFTINDEGIAHGSGRSISGCDLVAAFTECDQYLNSYGGHKMAAGASLKAENLPAFRKAFNVAVQKQLSKEDLVPVVKADVEVKIPQLTPKFFNVLRRMEPFGPYNMRPVLVTHGCTNRANPRVVGKGGAHLKLEVRADGSVIDAIGFGFGDRLREVQEAKSYTLAYTLSENEFRGRTTLQMMLKAIVIED